MREPMPSNNSNDELKLLRQAQLETVEDQGELAAELAKLRRSFDAHRATDHKTFVRLEKGQERLMWLVLAGIGAILSTGIEGKVGVATGGSTALLVLVAILRPEIAARLGLKVPPNGSNGGESK